MTTTKPLHDYDLGAPMSPAEIALNISRLKGSDGLRAVLQHLRNKAAEVCVTGRQPPQHLSTPGDYRAYHDGGADSLEEVFQEIHANSESSEPDDEGDSENGG